MPITLLLLAGFVDQVDQRLLFTLSGVMSVIMALVWLIAGREDNGAAQAKANQG